MKFLTKFRAKQGYKRFKRLVETRNFPHRQVSFSKVRTIGFVIGVKDFPASDLVVLTNYLTKLQDSGKKVLVIEVNEEKKGKSIFNMGIPSVYIGRENISWVGLPADKQISEMNARTPDILINLDRTGNPTCKYVLGLANAALRIGLFEEDEEQYYDMMMNVPENTHLRDLLRHIEKYVRMLVKEPENDPELNGLIAS